MVLRGLVAASFAAALLVLPAYLPASPAIIGSLSNFDVYNQTGDMCIGFEVEMDGVQPQDVYSLYNPWGYITSITATPTGTRVIYDGRTPSVQTPAGDLKHYGVHLNSTPTKVIYNWLTTDQLGQLAYAPLAAPAPIALPTPIWQASAVGITAGVYNSSDRPVWLKALHATQDTEVQLDQLMTDDPIVTSLGDENQVEPQLLDPGDTLSEVEDLLAATTAGGRAAFWVYAYIGDVDDAGSAIGNPTFETSHGDLLGTVMTAVNFVPEPASLAILALAASLVPHRRR